MKKKLKNNKKTKKYLDSLPKIYMIGCWAKYGVLEFPFTGKYTNNSTMPLVYNYEDFNGCRDNWYLRKLSDTTTGGYIGFAFNKQIAEKIANVLNTVREEELNFKELKMEEVKIRYSDNLTLSEALSVVISKSVIDNVNKIFESELNAGYYTYDVPNGMTVSIYKEGSGFTIYVGKDRYASKEE